MNDVKMTPLLLKLLKVLTDNPRHNFYGLELSKLLGKPYGSILPLLIKLEKAGWLETNLENIDPVEKGRPQRKYYLLTKKSKAKAKKLVQEEAEFWSEEIVVQPRTETA